MISPRLLISTLITIIGHQIHEIGNRVEAEEGALDKREVKV